MKYFYTLLLLLLFITFSEASTFDEMLQEEINPQTFLKDFDYQNYLQKVRVNDLKTIEQDRQALVKSNINGDDFIWALFEHYIQSNGLNFHNESGNVSELLELGEIMLHSTYYMPDSVFVYTGISDLIFETISKSLEDSIAIGEFDKHDFHIRYLVNRLCDNKYCIDISTPNWEKFIYHIQQGNWAYLWTKSTGTYLKEFLMAIAIIILISVLLVWMIYRIYKKRKKKQNVQNSLST
ncbi:MAG: hypothetical protein AB8G11_04500 [Saprospiraceae bacterium]